MRGAFAARPSERRMPPPVDLSGATFSRATPMTDLKQSTAEGEAHLFALADRMQFFVEKRGNCFTLTRTADLSEPERAADLTLDEAEDLLNTWKLRGLGGG